MATVTLAGRNDRFPVGTTVGFYPKGSRREGQAPSAASITTASADATGVTATNAGLLQGVDYELYAAVGGEHRYLEARSTLDVYAAPAGLAKPGSARSGLGWAPIVVARRTAAGTS